ncbi:MAG: response regulator transcription factor [Bacteroidia bacterium]|nr:response regulator transcription factor [Bacteroidia bacterium]
MRILIIEDERKVADFVSRGLSEAGHAVHVVYDGPKGLERARADNYDLLILDVMLPGMDGFEILEQLRSEGSPSRILLLTALEQTQDKIRGLNLGADDYLTKPFDFEELIARVNALLRRGNQVQQDRYEVADLTLDIRTQVVIRADRRIDLTHREFMLLRYLFEHRDQVISRAMIGRQVWNLGYETGTNVIDVYINYLRRKIDDGFEHKLIQTVRGQGYRFGDAP